MHADLIRRNDGLSRHSSGLTDAHKALIRMLAEIAVADYLRESEARETVAVPQEEAVRR
jgi:hypothetical protein